MLESFLLNVRVAYSANVEGVGVCGAGVGGTDGGGGSGVGGAGKLRGTGARGVGVVDGVCVCVVGRNARLVSRGRLRRAGLGHSVFLRGLGRCGHALC